MKGCVAPFLFGNAEKGSAASSKTKEMMAPLLAVINAKNTQNLTPSESETATV